MHPQARSAALAVMLSLSFLYGILSLSYAPTVQAANPAYPIDLYFHNDTSNPQIAGGFTNSIYTSNTSNAWSGQAQGFTNFTSRLTRGFYLNPSLAGDLTINGTIWLHPWVAGSGSGGSPTKASFTVSLWDVGPSGQTQVWASPSSGSLDMASGSTPAQSADVNSVPGNQLLIWTVSSYIFSAGHSILLSVDILPQGSGSTLSFYFDSQLTPSFLTLYVDNPVDVEGVWTADAGGAVTSVFPSGGLNLLVQIWANVTDPLGGYDVNASTIGQPYGRVTVTLLDPSGGQLLGNQRMNLGSGGPTSFVNLFRLNYTVSTPQLGQYNYTVTAVDNTGNVASANGSFIVGVGAGGPGGPGSPPPFWSTVVFQIVLLGLSLAALAGIIVYMLRRRSKSKPAGKGPTPTKLTQGKS